jgi:hypothetical protein
MSQQQRFELPASLTFRPEDRRPPFAPRFRYKNLTVSAALIEATKENPFDPDIRAIEVILETGDGGDDVLPALLVDQPRLTRTMVKIANRVFLALRHGGLLPYARDLPEWLLTADPKLIFSDFQAASRVDESSEWISLTEPDLERMLIARFLMGQARWPKGRMDPSRLAKVEELIESGRAPTPDEEFYVNALEHLEAGNFRMAVVETVICLELCVARLMTPWLTARGVKAESIEAYFAKDVGISARIAVMVPLMFHEALPSLDYDEKAVLRLVRLRNTVAHKTGRLEGISEVDIRALLSEGMKLAIYLSLQATALEARPRLDALEADLQETLGVRPKVFFFPPRQYLVTVNYGAFSAPTEDRLQEVIAAIGKRLAINDRRFEAAAHLEVNINQGNRGLAEWSQGRFTWKGQRPDASAL